MKYSHTWASLYPVPLILVARISKSFDPVKLCMCVVLYRATYLFVGGHHPVYSVGSHGPTACIVSKVLPLLYKYHVNAYFCGHDHDLQVSTHRLITWWLKNISSSILGIIMRSIKSFEQWDVCNRSIAPWFNPLPHVLKHADCVAAFQKWLKTRLITIWTLTIVTWVMHSARGGPSIYLCLLACVWVDLAMCWSMLAVCVNDRKELWKREQAKKMGSMYVHMLIGLKFFLSSSIHIPSAVSFGQ